MNLCLPVSVLATAIAEIDQLITTSDPAIDQLLVDVKVIQFRLNVTADYKFYILMNAIFTPARDILKCWTKYEEAFLSLVKEFGNTGGDRLLQTIVLFFRKNADLQPQLVDFFKLLYEQSLYPDSLYIDWFAGKKKLDKNSILYDRKAEKEVKPLLAEFIEWLQEDYGEEGEYGEEEAPKEEAKAQVSTQSALIEAQKRAQMEQMKAAAQEADEKLAEEKRRQAEEESKEQVKEVTDQVKIAQIQVADDFEIDDI